ncbi:MAG: hypothetical protein K6E30_10325 [Lachnospiraceae bacterium]|nr:hypothetical protein [Lachnospiraceae bacterium]
MKTYEITVGTLTPNTVFTGCALREEELVPEVSEDMVRIVPEYERVGKGEVLFAEKSLINATGGSLISDGNEAAGKRIRAFASSFTSEDFYRVYQLKDGIRSDVKGYSDLLENAGQGGSLVSMWNGIVSYLPDGMEELTEQDILSEGFEWDELTSGPVHASAKIATSEKWSLIIPVSARQVIDLYGDRTIRVHFLSDGESETGEVSWLQNSNKKTFLKLSFSSGMVRYLDSRFLKVRLEKNTASGIKIPLSSLVEKDFYIIPDEYRYLSGNGSGVSFMKISGQNNDRAMTRVVTPTVYAHIDGCYYVDKSSFSEGDRLLKPEDTEEYLIGETESLSGVFQVNNGYAVFRLVEELDRNEEFCLVREDSSYGLNPHDFIVFDGSAVDEKMIITE